MNKDSAEFSDAPELVVIKENTETKKEPDYETGITKQLTLHLEKLEQQIRKLELGENTIAIQDTVISIMEKNKRLQEKVEEAGRTFAFDEEDFRKKIDVKKQRAMKINTYEGTIGVYEEEIGLLRERISRGETIVQGLSWDFKELTDKLRELDRRLNRPYQTEGE